ncbi:DUF3102 domain-containing protein [Leptospira andrefontaineae]|uniref:DUF3102 domain-containing protein n=2 Tax=Leptospira andrefontaineae TaxID=2484976 RepID=A0A4R9GYP1_9LEPT|nr:DUF3102 domain-containing protein [Leptospira andrefontaineae]
MGNERKKEAILGSRTGFSRTEEAKDIVVDSAAKDLNALHQSILTSGKNMVKFAIEAGEILTKKKAELKHGEFLPWVEENLTFKIRTAQRYLKIYESRDSINASALTHLEDAYKLVAGPSTSEKEINPDFVDGIDPKILYKKYRNGESITKSERKSLREFLTSEKERILTTAKSKVSRIEEELKHL